MPCTLPITFISAMSTPKYIHPCHVHSQLHSSVPCQLPSTFIHAMQTLRTVIHSGTIPSTFIHTSTLISTYIHSSMVWKQRANFEGYFQWKLFAWGHDKVVHIYLWSKVVCLALPPQGQGLSHWIQLLEVLHY
jgi:hypothetical protein